MQSYSSSCKITALRKREVDCHRKWNQLNSEKWCIELVIRIQCLCQNWLQMFIGLRCLAAIRLRCFFVVRCNACAMQEFDFNSRIRNHSEMLSRYVAYSIRPQLFWPKINFFCVTTMCRIQRFVGNMLVNRVDVKVTSRFPSCVVLLFIVS